MLTIEDKKYVDTTVKSHIDRALKTVLKESDKNLGIVLDQFKYESKLTRELMSGYASREEVREIVDNEIKGHVSAYHTSI